MALATRKIEGLDVKEVFGSCFGYNLDDLMVVPGYGTCTTEQVDLETSFSRNVSLHHPIIAAPLRTVTEGRMALAMALSGGIGVIHCNCSPVVQAGEVKFVKEFSHGFIMNPQCLAPNSTIADLEKVKAVSDCSSALITEGGKMGTKLHGIVTARDTDCVSEKTTYLFDVMTPLKTMQEKGGVVCGERLDEKGKERGISFTEAIAMLQDAKVSRLPIINKADEVVALVSRSDMKRNRDYPKAAKDSNLQPVVAACVKLGTQGDAIFERVRMLVDSGADALIIDGSECDVVQQVEFIKRTRRDFPSVDVVAGPVSTPREAKPLIDAGADGLRVSAGGNSCIRSVGRPLGNAIYHVAKSVRENKLQVPVIADGCIETSHHIAMALALGASSVMCGSLFAGTRESPGEAFMHNGTRLKLFPGPHSPTPESLPSVACAAVDRGPVEPLVNMLIDGLRGDFSRFGVAKLEALHDDLKNGNTKFKVRTR